MSDNNAPTSNAAPAAAPAAAASAAAVVDVAAMSAEERCAYAKDQFGRGSRNYLVKEYTEAADVLSEVCTLYEEIYGNNAAELGMPYLLYAKSLIALAQGGENKLLVDVPEEEEEQDDDDEEDDDGEEEQDGTAANAADAEDADTSKTNVDAAAAAAGPSNGTTSNGSTTVAGTSGASSSSNGVDADETIADGEEPEDDSPAANLQVAWEVLELAVQIFLRQGDGAASNLADAYFELAEISLENSHFETAVRDYKNSLDIHMKLPHNNLRLIAEIEYKIGLGQLMLSAFEESVVAFRKACEVLDAEIATQKSDSEKAASSSVIAELEDLKLEILNKITEVEEAKQQSVAEVKEELAKLMSHEPAKKGAACGDAATAGAAGGGSSSSSGAAGGSGGGSSSSASAAATSAKPMDISHLVKRKKPDSVASDAATEGSPAKKSAP